MRIEQTLHGYADGHRLLAGSVEVARQSHYLMLGLSDMSGRSMVPGFDEYLTGYPLPEVGYYAFARTWYAQEMERPGCVWTHTLLISESDLGALPDLGRLRRLFRRPMRGDGPVWDEYRQPLEFTVVEADVTFIPPWQEQSARLALWGLYGVPDLPFFHPADDARQLEDLTVALWSQQWPSLRFAHRFCSGAIGVRAIGKQPFDYQVIPISSIREVRRDVPASTIVASRSLPLAPESSEWLRLASGELCGFGGLSLRAFLREHAVTGFDGRCAFAPLTELHSLWAELQGQTNFEGLLEVVGDRYPEPAGASRLKHALVGTGFPLATSLVPGISEREVLQAISTSPVVSAYNDDELEVELRASTLWGRERRAAEALTASLIGNELNPLGERVLLALIQGISIEDAIRLSDVIPGLVATSIRLNPDHAKSPAVWKGTTEHQRGLFDAVTAGEVPADTQEAIIQAMLEAGSDAVADQAARKFGPVVVNTVMTWFDESGATSPRDVRDGWRRALSMQTSALLDWLAGREEIQVTSGALIADLLDPHSHEVHARGADLWLKVLSNDGAILETDVRNRLYAFLLALGFDAPPGRPDELVACTFDTVHRAIAGNRLGEESWDWLDGQLPLLSFWRYWDRCERLRLGLAERFINHNWPIAQFFRCAPNRDALRNLLEACDKINDGNSLLKRIRRALVEEEVELDCQRRDVVDLFI